MPGSSSRTAAGRLDVSAGGQAVALGWAGLDVRVRGRDGFAAAAERDVVVALDTAVPSALHRKAIARHLVHQVQTLRKEAGLSVADRIRLAVDGDAEAARALEEHGEYVCAETLADELRCAPPPEGWRARGRPRERARHHRPDPRLRPGAAHVD